MGLSKILKNAFWFGVVPKFSSIVSIFVLPLVTPYLTPEDYGIYGIITAYLSFFTGVCTLGLHIHLPNSFFVYKTKYKLLWRRIFGTLLIVCFFLSIILFLIYAVLLKDIPLPQRIWVSILAVLPLLFNANGLISSNYYVLIGKPKPLVLRNLIGSLVSICTFFICARFLKLGYLSWLIASALSTIIIFILFIRPIWIREQIFPQIEKSKKRAIKLIKVALPVIPHNLGHNLLSSSDRVIMSILGLSLFDIGLYSNGHQLGDYASFAIIGLFTAISPIIQKAYRNNEKSTLLYYFYTTHLLTLSLVFMLSLWMREIYQLLIRNEALQDSYLVASTICFSFSMYCNYYYMSSIVFINEKTSKILYLVFIPGILNILLAFILIPHYGYMGGGYAMLIANWSISLIPFIIPFYRKELLNILDSLLPIFVIILINILCFTISIFCKDETILYKIIFSTFFILIMLVIYKIILKRKFFL